MNLDLVNTPSVLKRICESYRNGYSPIIEVVGKMRVGKTTKAFLCANWLSWILFKHGWDWKSNTIIDVDQLLRKLKERNSGDIMIMDEVQKQLSKKRWNDPSSKLFSDLMSSQAYKHYIIFLILPKAWELGSDHATSVNFVMPWHSRQLCMPYRVEAPFWNIALKKKEPPIFPLSHFKINLRRRLWQETFKDELIDLEEFRKYIEINLKEKIIIDALIKRGVINRNTGEVSNI